MFDGRWLLVLGAMGGLLGCSGEVLVDAPAVVEPQPETELAEPEPEGAQVWTRYLPANKGPWRRSMLAVDEERRVYLHAGKTIAATDIVTGTWAFDPDGSERWSAEGQEYERIWMSAQGRLATLSQVSAPRTVTYRHPDGTEGETHELPWVVAWVNRQVGLPQQGFVLAGSDMKGSAQVASFLDEGQLSWDLLAPDLGEHVTDVDSDAEGHIYLSGWAESTGYRLMVVDSNGGILAGPVETCGEHMAAGPQGVVVLGIEPFDPPHPTELRVTRCKHALSSLQLLWSQERNVDGKSSTGEDIAQDRWGNIITMGSYWALGTQPIKSELWLRKYDPDGVLLWERTEADEDYSTPDKNMFFPLGAMALKNDAHGAILATYRQEDGDEQQHVLRKLTP